MMKKNDRTSLRIFVEYAPLALFLSSAPQNAVASTMQISKDGLIFWTYYPTAVLLCEVLFLIMRREHRAIGQRVAYTLATLFGALMVAAATGNNGLAFMSNVILIFLPLPLATIGALMCLMLHSTREPLAEDGAPQKQGSAHER
jgi:peptidoglycan/LPS O-acetylase OafA/YrhL